jgi:non-specific serine/threonine protein kinase
MDRLETEHDNLRAALAWCSTDTDAREGQDEEVGLRLATALIMFWDVRGYFSEGREHLARALSCRAGARTAAAAMALIFAGGLAGRQGDNAAAQPLLEESLAIYRELGDKHGIAIAMINLSNVVNDRRDFATARSLLEASLAVLRELGDKRGIGLALNNLGAHHMSVVGDYSLAHSLFDECLALRREFGDPRGIAEVVNNLGLVEWFQGDFAASRSRQEEALRISQQIGDRRGVATYLEDLGMALSAESQVEKQVEKAVILWGVADALRESIGSSEQPLAQSLHDSQVAKVRSLLGEAAFQSAWEAGRAMLWERAVGFALEKDAALTPPE